MSCSDEMSWAEMCNPHFATGTLDGMEITSQQACCHCGGGSVPLLHGLNSTASHLPQCEFVALMQATNDAIASGDVSSLSSHAAYQACAGVAETIGSVQISASCHQGGP
eukprot:COSAG02_NODE_12019_length_1612_cov_1.508923_2_plen_109_part_00